MTYRELFELTQKHPTCFWTKEQRAKDFEYKLKCWIDQQNNKYASKKVQ